VFSSDEKFMLQIDSHSQEIIIRSFNLGDANDLIQAGFPFDKKVLNPPLKHKILRVMKLSPVMKRFVAYHLSEKKTIGFLSLVKCSSFIYSIQYLFVDPRYRRMGIATNLLTEAISFAKIRGAKKFYADVLESNTASRELFKKLGFKTLFIAVWASGKIISNSEEVKGFSSTTPLSLRWNKTILFDIYQKSVSSDWISFFEITINNFHKGYVYRYHRLVQLICRKYFINESRDSFAIVYKCPFSNMAFIELYSIGNSATVKHMLQDIFTLLSQTGVETINIMFFGKHKNEIYSLLKEMGFNTLWLQTVGKEC